MKLAHYFGKNGAKRMSMLTNSTKKRRGGLEEAEAGLDAIIPDVDVEQPQASKKRRTLASQ